MTDQPKFVAGWVALSATLTLLCVYVMLSVLPAAGLTSDLWFPLVMLPPAVVVGLIVGRASKDDRRREASLGFLLAVTIATMILLAVQPEAEGIFVWLAPVLSGAQIAIGTVLTHVSASFGRKRRYRVPRGWRLE
ncbi:MAG: hypothetical protein Tsb0020_40410 [Haliangiales bacterium]